MSQVRGITGRPKGVCMCGPWLEYAEYPGGTKSGLAKVRSERGRYVRRDMEIERENSVKSERTA